MFRRAIAVAIAALLALAACDVAHDNTPVPAGYRYTDSLDRWAVSARPCLSGRLPDAGVTYEQEVEIWVDRNMNGHRMAHQGTVIKGDRNAAKGSAFYEPSEGPYGWGDAPRPKLAEMPIAPGALHTNMIAEYKSRDWAPGHPTDAQVHDDVARQALIVLSDADTQPRASPGAVRRDRIDDGRPIGGRPEGPEWS